MDKKEIRILFICDNKAECMECEKTLVSNGLIFLSRHINNKTELGIALKDFNPDIVLTDSTLKSFHGVTVVDTIRLKDPDLPVIFVTDSVGEEKIIEMFKNGASDVVFKNQMSRLVPTIKRALREAEHRREKILAEIALEQSEKNYKGLFEDSPVALLEEDYSNIKAFIDNLKKEGVSDLYGYFNANPEELGKCASMIQDMTINKKAVAMAAARDGDHLKKNRHAVMSSDARIGFKGAITAFSRGEHSFECEASINTLNGEKRYIAARISIVPGYEDTWGKVILSLIDITLARTAEEAIKRSEERYRLIVETATEGIIMIDKNDVISFANKRICEMTGFSCEELVGKDIFELMDDDWKVTARSDIESLRRGGRERHDFKFKRNDGTDLWSIVSSTPIFGEMRQYSGALIMVTGISERKRAEEASRSVENKYRKLMEMATDAIFIIDPDTGTILDVNRRAEDLMGLTLERLMGMNYQLLHPKDKIRHYRMLFEDCVKTGKSIITDAVVVRADGKIVPVEIRANIVGIGGKKVLQGLFRDMTERVAFEEKLRLSEERLKAILNNSQSMIYGRDMNGRYIFINKAFEKLLHLKEKRVLENTPYDIFTKDVADMFQKTDVQVLETSQALEIEETIPLPDGVHTYATQKFPLIGPDKKIYAMCSIATDITRYKCMEAALEKSNTELRETIKKNESGKPKASSKKSKKS